MNTEDTIIDLNNLPVYSSEHLEKLLYLNDDIEKNREKIILSNLRLVKSVVLRFKHVKEQSEDLFQIGCLGLIKAVDNFDVNVGGKFSTYAVPMVIGEIQRYLRSNSPIRVSRRLKKLAYEIKISTEELTRSLEREPKPIELANHLGVSIEEIHMAVEANMVPKSLNEPFPSREIGSPEIIDILPANNEYSQNLEYHILIKDSLKSLEPMESKIFQRRYIEGRTQTEVAKEFKIAQYTISRLEKKIFKKLKSILQQ
ncbi:sigma-70 family RNA polymerase sigma factor [Mesobacillus jeotgali]|uniref:sigma-70 family RNA polymerase sigma factor n=1 Tax=Mesobacillus jeotgali TaxID=129985 RepID=UPI001CFD56BE|nr:sigma-70 family RNA polymerase sigma factor [Mesobacillus jeotgali]